MQKSDLDSSGVMVGGSWTEICTRGGGVVLRVEESGRLWQPRESRTLRIVRWDCPCRRYGWSRGTGSDQESELILECVRMSVLELPLCLISTSM